MCLKLGQQLRELQWTSLEWQVEPLIRSAIPHFTDEGKLRLREHSEDTGKESAVIFRLVSSKARGSPSLILGPGLWITEAAGGNSAERSLFLSVVFLVKRLLLGWHMVRLWHVEENFHPTVCKNYFLVHCLPYLTLLLGSRQCSWEAKFTVIIRFHKVSVHFWRATEGPGEMAWVEVREGTKTMVGNEKYSNIN